MTPEQKLKHLILLRACVMSRLPAPEGITKETIDALYDEMAEKDQVQDAEAEIRGSGVATDLPCKFDRNYESQSVARQALDGSWVGWTYWTGGGKHGNPDEMPWMQYAYDLDCKEEEKLVIVRTFTTRNPAAA